MAPRVFDRKRAVFKMAAESARARFCQQILKQLYNFSSFPKDQKMKDVFNSELCLCVEIAFISDIY